MNVFMTITLNSSSGKLLISVSLGFFCGFILFFPLEHVSLSPHFVLRSVYFYQLGRVATSPSLEEVTLCKSIPCVGCMCLVALAGQLELEQVQAMDS